MASKSLCAACENKNANVFKCEGCAQTFCRKHSNEHRDSLNHQLDEIILEHDILQYMTVEKKGKENDHQNLIKQIDRWENNSIMKIRQTATEERKRVEKLTATQNDAVPSKLRDLTERLREAKENDSFFETDLRLWNKRLQELKIELADICSTVTIREDPSTKFIAKLYATTMNERSEEDEILVRLCGSVQIEDNGRAAFQRDSSCFSYVRGRNEYSFGKYKIRFNVNKIELSKNTIFGITSTTETFSDWPSSCYGWSNNDVEYCSRMCHSNDTNTESDLKGRTSFTIQLIMDCDNQKIQYIN